LLGRCRFVDFPPTSLGDDEHGARGTTRLLLPLSDSNFHAPARVGVILDKSVAQFIPVRGWILDLLPTTGLTQEASHGSPARSWPPSEAPSAFE
jgi:hypothetical protein